MKKIQWVQIVSNALPNKYQNMGCVIFAMGRCCIKIGQHTHVESIGLIQKCQAFFIWNKGRKSLYSVCHQSITSIETQVYNEYLGVFSQNTTTI